jgi:hypothetical protein
LLPGEEASNRKILPRCGLAVVSDGVVMGTDGVVMGSSIGILSPQMSIHRSSIPIIIGTLSGSMGIQSRGPIIRFLIGAAIP